VRSNYVIGQEKRRRREREQLINAIAAASFAEGFIAARPSAARQLNAIRERVAEAARKVKPKAKV
jgi:hypothetical protein